MAQVNAYLNFNGNCREAMTFYKECLGGELSLQTFEGTPMEAQCPAAMKHQIMHSSLMNPGFLLMATDMAAPEGFQKGNDFSLALNCNSEEEINSLFSNLSKGGKVIEPLKLQFWGDVFGCIIDKYGVSWMFTYNEKMQNEAS